MIVTFLGTAAANAYPEAFCQCDNCERARALVGPSLRFDRRQIFASALITELVAKYPVRDVSVEEPEIKAIVRDIYEHSVPGERLEDQCS
jgi:ABC-type uncharacterized transport system ATPase subunit